MIVGRGRERIPSRYIIVLLISLLLSACNSSAPLAASTPVATTTSPSGAAVTTPAPPNWFNTNLTDVQTGESITINDLRGKVVLIETMAEWCPNCRAQEDEVKKLHALLDDNPDLVSISLDVDLHEDAASLKEYASKFGYDWHFVVAPLDVMRDFGNLYSAQYLNPPLAPMLLIDRQGKVYGLPYNFKSAEALRATIEPYLSP